MKVLFLDTSTIVSKEVHNQFSETLTIFDRLQSFFLDNAGNIIAGILIIVIGLYVSKFIKRLIHNLMTRANYDRTVNSFVSQLVYYSLVFLTLISGLSRLGVPATSFVAMIGGLGLAVGLALQNNMANFASGLLLLVFKPFRVGDWISLGSSSDIVGSVDRIELLYTTVITKERRCIFVPNSQMTSNAIINTSYNDVRRLRFDIGISYNNDHHTAIKILKGIMMDGKHILNPENVEVGITSFGDNSVNISIFPEVERDKALETFYYVMSEIKDRFDANNINIPFPQRDVHIYYENTPPQNNVPTKVTGEILD